MIKRYAVIHQYTYHNLYIMGDEQPRTFSGHDVYFVDAETPEAVLEACEEFEDIACEGNDHHYTVIPYEEYESERVVDLNAFRSKVTF